MPKHDNFSDVGNILNEYSLEIQEELTTTAQTLANQAVEELRAVKGTYKIRTGKYNKGWRVKENKGMGFINCIVYNATNWQLTHLLEKGHRLIGRDGQLKGRTKAFVHLKPVEEKYVNEYVKNVERIIKNGG